MPVFNEEATVAAVVDRLLAVELPVPREIIVINDGSRDGTQAVLAGRSAGRPGLVVLDAPRNRGKGHAVRLGLARARGTIMAVQDADLELDPAELGSLVSPLLAGDAAGKKIGWRDGASAIGVLLRHRVRGFASHVPGAVVLRTSYFVLRTSYLFIACRRMAVCLSASR